MKTLFCASLLGLLGVASVHCAANSTELGYFDDGGATQDLPPVERDAALPSSDSDSGPEVADAGNCSTDHWCRTLSPDSDYQLTAVWSFAADDAIAATATTPIHWDGTAWTPVDAPEAEGLTCLWASTPNDIWGVARFNYRLVHGTRAAVGQPFRWSKVEYDSDSSPSLELVRGVGEHELWAYGRTSAGERPSSAASSRPRATPMAVRSRRSRGPRCRSTHRPCST